MKSQNIRFTDPAGRVLTVYQRFGKRGVNVGASVKVKGGGKAVTVDRAVFEYGEGASEPSQEVLDQSNAKFAEFLELARSKGWTVRVRPVAKPKDRKTPELTGIPDASDTVNADEIPANEPAPEPQAEPATADDNGGKKNGRNRKSRS